MAKLTPKQAAFVKLDALRLICAHIGAWPVSKEIADRNRALVGNDTLQAVIVGLVHPDNSPIGRAACATILDLVSTNWRIVAGPAVIGPLVARSSPEARAWRTAVLDRDGNACRQCGSSERLHAHHIVRWVDSPELRVDVDNGLTLCEPCHKAVHLN